MTRDALRKHRLLLFYALAFPLSWYPWWLALARGSTTGPNPLGPFAAALIVTALLDGRSGLRALLARLVRWRVGALGYLAAFGVPIALVLVASALTDAATLGARLAQGIAWGETVERFVFIFLFIGLGEEPGWRGFALEDLQERHSPLGASLRLAPVWALWHLPLLGNEFPPPIIAPFVLCVLGGTLFQTWLYNRTRGSVLLQMLLHATVNTIASGFVFPAYSGAAQVELWWIYSGTWLLAGGVALGLGTRSGATVGNGAPAPIAGR